jgi:hypothetical protein
LAAHSHSLMYIVSIIPKRLLQIIKQVRLLNS